MARRHGRNGSWLATDDYTGFTVYANKLKRDYWGSYSVRPLQRNLQEIATPLDDPGAVSLYRPSNYETYVVSALSHVPTFVGTTTVSSKPDNMAYYVLFYQPPAAPIITPGIGNMVIGSTFVIS